MNRKATLLSYMPTYYTNSKVIDNINNSNGLELDNLDETLDKVLNQFFVNTSDSSLLRWEKELGLEIGNKYDVDLRRSRILSKLKGQGTITVDSLKNIAKSFIADVDIKENNEHSNFMIILKSNKGFPHELTGLYESIEEIKPAHLSSNYKLISIVESKIYSSAVSISAEEIIVYPWQNKKLDSSGKIKIAMSGSIGLEQTTIYPR